MEKTYKILNHSKPISASEIERLYNGYWVFIVKAVIDEYGGIVSGIPAVIGKMAADGAFDGIYEKYRTDEYKQTAEMNLLPNNGFISALKIVGEPIG